MRKFLYKQRGSEAEQMQSQYISESQKLSCFCRDTILLAENVNDRDIYLDKNVIDREGQKQNICSLNVSLIHKTFPASAEIKC